MSLIALLLILSYIVGVMIIAESIRDEEHQPDYNAPYSNEYKVQALLLVCIALAFAGGVLVGWGR